MSNQNRKDRERWIRGEPSPEKDDFGRSADRGREELSSAAEARELMQELDLAFTRKIGGLEKGEGNSVGSVGGADAGSTEGSKSNGQGTTVRRLSRLYAVAAAILLLVAAGSWWISTQQTMSNEALFVETFTPYPNELSSRAMGGEDAPAPLSEKLAAASLAYDRRDYAAAATAFADYRSLAPAGSAELAEVSAATTTDLYYGISLLGANKAREAIPVFDRLIAGAPGYRDTASWYRALALLRDEQTEAARQALNDIANLPSSPFAPRANKLLKAFQ